MPQMLVLNDHLDYSDSSLFLPLASVKPSVAEVTNMLHSIQNSKHYQNLILGKALLRLIYYDYEQKTLSLLH